MNTILVTGAAGRVGNRLVGSLLDKGYAVRGLILPNDPTASRLDTYSDRIEILAGNLLETATCARAIDGVDGVIHTANLLSPLPGMSESDFFDGNVRGTFNLLQAAGDVADRIERFVHFSSSAVYPNDTHQLRAEYHPVDENHPTRPVHVYGLTKHLNDVNVEFAVRRRGLQAVMVRPSGIQVGSRILRAWRAQFVGSLLRTGQAHPESDLYAGESANLWERLEGLSGGPEQLVCPRGSEGNAWLYQPVHVEDVVHGAVCALEADGVVGEAFNLAAPEPIGYDEATAYLAEKTGETVVDVELPVHWHFDLGIDKAKERIGYAPTYGMKKMIDTALEVERAEPGGANA